MQMFNGLEEHQRNQFVWEPLKIFKFGGQLSRTTNLRCQVFLSFEVIIFSKINYSL
jgi:hypothetical protein